jgi:hypothetical protein
VILENLRTTPATEASLTAAISGFMRKSRPPSVEERRAGADQVAHDEPEIEAARMNQQALEDIGVAAQMRAAHPTGVVEMGEGAFDPLAPLTHQAPAACSTNPPPIGIHQGLGGEFL